MAPPAGRHDGRASAAHAKPLVQERTVMSHPYWGLTESPFSSPGNRFFFRTATNEEALARLQFLCEHRRRVGLLVGPPGAGKTRLLAIFARLARQAGRQVASTSALGVGAAELLSEVARAFGVSLPPTASVAAAWRTIDDFLAASRYQNLDSVLLVDDVDECDPAAAQQLARLSQTTSAAGGRLSLVLAGRNRLLGALGSRLLDLVELRIDLELWEAAETKNFLREALVAAGLTKEVFAPAAVARLHELSGGSPRRVMQLAELCLVAGAAIGSSAIDPQTVESVHFELGVTGTATALA